MKILVAHNFYQQPGGEDQCVAAEVAMLKAHGDEVFTYNLHNDSIASLSRLHVAARTIWSTSAYHEVREMIRAHRPQLVHFHNTFPLISPAAYYAARAEGVPVVQTLHNYRLLCANSLFMRDGRVCEDCLGKRVGWSGVRHGCYRGSRAASAVVAALQAVHRAGGTWDQLVDVYVALTEFARQKFIEGGLPASKLIVKPNFVFSDNGPGPGDGGYALFVGRLSEEKGIDTLLSAWTQDATLPPLRIIGGGPLARKVEDATLKCKRIEWLGRRTSAEVQHFMSRAMMLVLPSICYEGLPATIIESFCQGTPVVASRIGAIPALIDEGRTGLLVEPGNATALAQAVAEMAKRSEQLPLLRRQVRRAFERSYTAEQHYRAIIGIYATALRRRGNQAASDELLATVTRESGTAPLEDCGPSEWSDSVSSLVGAVPIEIASHG